MQNQTVKEWWNDTCIASEIGSDAIGGREEVNTQLPGHESSSGDQFW